jgi:hypothetical protein
MVGVSAIRCGEHIEYVGMSERSNLPSIDAMCCVSFGKRRLAPTAMAGKKTPGRTWRLLCAVEPKNLRS